MKLLKIILLLQILIFCDVYSQKKVDDSNFKTFWKEFTTAYVKHDTDWFKKNSYDYLFESCKGCGPFEIFDVNEFNNNIADRELDKEYIKKLAKIKLKDVTEIKCSESLLSIDFGDEPTYKRLKLKENDKITEVLVDGILFVFTKKNDKYKYLGIYFYETE